MREKLTILFSFPVGVMGDFNTFTGSIPDSFANLDLIVLRLGVNNFTDSEIPPFIYGMTNLLDLRLQSCNWTSSINDAITGLTGLDTLWLQGNSLTGKVPTNIGSLVALTDLVLGQNALTGQIPNSIASLTALQSLVLQDNQLTGQIPSTIAALVNLGSLDLSLNRFTGTIPTEIGAVTGLSKLHIRDRTEKGCVRFPAISYPVYLFVSSTSVIRKHVDWGNSFIAWTTPKPC